MIKIINIQPGFALISTFKREMEGKNGCNNGGADSGEGDLALFAPVG